MSVFLIFSILFVWSSSFALGKVALNSAAAPIFVTAFRMLLAGGVLINIVLLKKKKFILLNKKFLFYLFLLSLTGFYLTNVLEFYSLQYLTSANVSFIYGLSPFITAVFSYIQLKEIISWRKFFGLMIGFLGYFPYLVYRNISESGSLSLGWPEISLIAATFLASFGWTLMRKIEKEFNISILALNGLAMFFSGGMAFIHSYLWEDWGMRLIINPCSFWRSLLLFVIISNLLCYNLYGWLLKQFTSTFLSFCGLIMPFFSAFFGWVLLNETLSLSLVISVLIMVVGFWMVYKEELRLGYING